MNFRCIISPQTRAFFARRRDNFSLIIHISSAFVKKAEREPAPRRKEKRTVKPTARSQKKRRIERAIRRSFRASRRNVTLNKPRRTYPPSASKCRIGKSERREIFRPAAACVRRNSGAISRAHNKGPAEKIRRAPQTMRYLFALQSRQKRRCLRADDERFCVKSRREGVGIAELFQAAATLR